MRTLVPALILVSLAACGGDSSEPAAADSKTNNNIASTVADEDDASAGNSNGRAKPSTAEPGGSGAASSDAATSADPASNRSNAPSTDGGPAQPASASGGTNAMDAGSVHMPSGLPDVVFTMDVKIAAGAEKLMCMYVAMPRDRGVIAVSGAESHYTPGSHHMLAYRSDLIGVPLLQGAPFDCDNNSSWVLHNKGSYYEAQQPDSARELPNGIAHKFQPNEVVILQAHYVNTKDAATDAHIELIMHTVDLASVKYEAGSILFSNLGLSIRPHSKIRASMTCPIPQDFNPALLWSHMHKRGANFVATTDDKAAAAALGTLYEEPDWSEPKPRVYPSDPSVTLHAGSHITFSCDFTNETDKTVTYGNSAVVNEMCIFHGMYWPRMTAAGAESCRGGVTSSQTL